jgi:hypothetical protein
VWPSAAAAASKKSAESYLEWEEKEKEEEEEEGEGALLFKYRADKVGNIWEYMGGDRKTQDQSVALGNTFAIYLRMGMEGIGNCENGSRWPSFHFKLNTFNLDRN